MFDTMILLTVIRKIEKFDILTPLFLCPMGTLMKIDTFFTHLDIERNHKKQKLERRVL